MNRQPRDAAEGAAETRRQLHEYLSARPHRYHALAAAVFLVPGLILMIIFFSYTERTTESGHLWWKRSTTTDVTIGDKLPLLVAGLILIGAATVFAISATRRFRLQNVNVAAVASVKSLRQKRSTARELASRDPQMASDLKIGRPDLHREYDDGGLVDVNAASADVLVSWLGLDIADAVRVESTRKHLGRFEDPAELVSLAGLEPTTLDRVRDRIILL